MAIRKTVKRVARKVRGAAIKRYFKKGYKPRMNNIIKDVKYLKSVLNPEKKRWNYYTTDQPVGQCNVDANGFYCLDITPNPAQGITSSTRNGNSIKLSATNIKMQFQAQSTGIGAKIRFKVMIVKVLGQPTSASNFMARFLQLNRFVTLSGAFAITDYNSDRNEEMFKQYIPLRTKYITLGPNQHNGQTSITTTMMGMRYKSHHVKFTADGTTNVADGQLFLVVLADGGNCGPSVSNLVGTGVISANSGANFQMDLTHYFYDN